MTNKIKFTDLRVVAAIDVFGSFAKNDAYVDGGAAGVASTDFRDSPKGLFSSPPKCYMHRQASFIPRFFPEGTKLGEDADFFYFPPSPRSRTSASRCSAAARCSPSPRTRRARARSSTSSRCRSRMRLWMAQSGFLTPHKGVNIEAYNNPTLKKEGEILANATTFRFDGSDLMPGKIGAGAFWTGMVDFVGGKSAAEPAPRSRRPGTKSSRTGVLPMVAELRLRHRSG